jgi:protocatechuate 3,4-dioxygenase beta subunit
MPNDLNRRDVMKGGAAVFFSGAMSALETFLTGCASGASSISSNSVEASASCVASTNVTRGPYFVDNQFDPYISNDVVDPSIPERPDIRSDSKGSTGPQTGLPLTLTISVGAYTNGACSPIANAQVHIWHCNAQGVYSDIEAGSNDDGANLTGENFLRGYQYT